MLVCPVVGRVVNGLVGGGSISFSMSKLCVFTPFPLNCGVFDFLSSEGGSSIFNSLRDVYDRLVSNTFGLSLRDAYDRLVSNTIGLSLRDVFDRLSSNTFGLSLREAYERLF